MPYNEEAGQTNDGAAGGVFWKGGQGQPVLQSTITADIATIIQNRVASEEAAADALASEQAALVSKDNAATSASNAAISAGNAATSAAAALVSENNADASELAASNSAASASNSAAAALVSKDNAATSASNAATSAGNAATSAAAALVSENNAAQSAANAAASAASIPNNVLVAGDIGVRVEPYDSTILKDADIGVTVQPFDATLLKSADIGVTVQAFDAATAKLNQAANFTAGLQDTGESLVRKKNGDTGAARLPVGTTLQQPVGEAGLIRFNSTDNSFEGHNGTGWGSIGGQLAGNRNKIINGAFNIAQRNTSGTSANAYTVDRWLLFHTGTAPTWNQAVGGSLLTEYFPSLFSIPGAAGNTGVTLTQRIEALNSADLTGKTVTFSAYVLHQGTGGNRNFVITAQRPNASDDWSGATLIASSGSISVPLNTWTRVTWTTTLPASGPNLGLSFELGFGAITADQLFFVTGVQLEVGSVATSFEHRFIGQELALCQRYYSTGTYNFTGYAAAGAGYTTVQPFPVTMRAPPSMGTSGVTTVNTTSPSLATSGTTGFVNGGTATALGTVIHAGTYTASSEL